VELLLVLLMLLLIGLVSAQILMRYVFRSPLTWSEELARMTFVYLTFIGAGLAFHRRENLRLTTMTDELPEGARLWLRAATQVAEIGFLGIVLAWSVPLLQRLAPAPTPALEWSMDCFYAGVAIGGLVILGFAIGGLVTTLRRISARRRA
jgi:TRAP-type transport system small permease protein